MNEKESNAQNGFVTADEAVDYVNAKKEWWGSNLVGWVEERDGRWYPCFNVWD